jgi:hypothetical protein
MGNSRGRHRFATQNGTAVRVTRNYLAIRRASLQRCDRPTNKLSQRPKASRLRAVTGQTWSAITLVTAPTFAIRFLPGSKIGMYPRPSAIRLASDADCHPMNVQRVKSPHWTNDSRRLGVAPVRWGLGARMGPGPWARPVNATPARPNCPNSGDRLPFLMASAIALATSRRWPRSAEP